MFLMSGMLEVMGKARIMMQELKSLSSLRYEWKMWHSLHSLFLREIIVFIEVFMIYKSNDESAKEIWNTLSIKRFIDINVQYSYSIISISVWISSCHSLCVKKINMELNELRYIWSPFDVKQREKNYNYTIKQDYKSATLHDL